MQTESLYSISVHLQSGLIRGVGGLWCEWPYSISVHLKSGLIRGVAFGERGLIRGGTTVTLCSTITYDFLHSLFYLLEEF